MAILNEFDRAILLIDSQSQNSKEGQAGTINDTVDTI